MFYFILFSNTLKPFSVMKVFAAGVGFDLAAGVGDRFGRGWVVPEGMGIEMGGDEVEKWF
jgi:hypothetical protein